MPLFCIKERDDEEGWEGIVFVAFLALLYDSLLSLLFSILGLPFSIHCLWLCLCLCLTLYPMHCMFALCFPWFSDWDAAHTASLFSAGNNSSLLLWSHWTYILSPSFHVALFQSDKLYLFIALPTRWVYGGIIKAWSASSIGLPSSLTSSEQKKLR